MKRPARSVPSTGPRLVAYLHDNVEFGGIETLQLQILAHLDRARYRAIVVVAEYADGSADRFRESLAAAGVPMLTPSAGPDVPAISGAARIWKLQRLLRNERVDVAHIQTRTPQASRRLTLAAALAGTPATIRTEHVSPGPHVGKHIRPTLAPFDWLTDLVITDSHADRREQIELVGRPESKVVTSYCGIDPFAFDPDHDVGAAKAALGIDPAVTVIGTVGRLHEQKGHRYLLDAAALIAERQAEAVVFLIVGDGPEQAALEAQTATLGLTDVVMFAGFQDDAVPYMQAMDIVVMPSLWEGFSISMQEFMAMGKPMVVSDHHSFQEAMVDGVHGLIVPMRDGAALADGVLCLLKDPELGAALGAAAADRARREFSIQRHAAELMDFYDATLAARVTEAA